jgi:hypothetical protein
VSSHRTDVAIVAIAFTVFGLVGLALLWSGGWAYEALARATDHTSTTFTTRSSGTVDSGEYVTDLANLLSWHGAWASYVTGLRVTPPSNPTFFTDDEVSHMADVRRVFAGAELAATLALAVVGFRLFRARRRGDAIRLARDGALAAAGLVAAVGFVAVFAFDRLFLLFHEVFFPQGNFLFAPNSNLIRLYPEWYWQGITAGVGVSFIAVALLVAAAAHVALGRRSTTYTRAA